MSTKSLPAGSGPTFDDGVRRGPGRPPARDPDETRRTIFQAATAEFVAEGYAGASMQRIARRAGVSTRTLYTVADGKEALFRIVVAHRIGQITDGLAATFAPEALGRDELRRIGRVYGTFILCAETVATVRILLEEQSRFPDLMAFLQDISQQVSEIFESRVREILATETADPAGAAFKARLMRLVFLGEQRQRMLRLGAECTDDDIEGFADSVVTFFADQDPVPAGNR